MDVHFCYIREMIDTDPDVDRMAIWDEILDELDNNSYKYDYDLWASRKFADWNGGKFSSYQSELYGYEVIGWFAVRKDDLTNEVEQILYDAMAEFHKSCEDAAIGETNG